MNFKELQAKSCFLFDLDGTLIDTKKANLLSYQVALSEQGFEICSEIIEETWGMDSSYFLPRIVPDQILTSLQVKEIQQRKSELYPQFFENTIPNYPLISLVQLAKTMGITIGLVTTAKSLNAIPLLNFHGLTELFDFFVFGEDVINGKPSPEPYLKAVELSGKPLKSHLVFEDSRTGITSALNAGLEVVKIGTF